MSETNLTPDFSDLNKPEAIINHIEQLTENGSENESAELSNWELLQKIKIDLTKELPPPPICLFMGSEGSEQPICTLGNFSLVIGKAKSRKSFLMAIALAAATKNGRSLNFKANLPKEKHNVIYFDTEQGEYHVLKAGKRIVKLVSASLPVNLNVYPLREFDAAKRLELVETAINETKNLGFVVIDGIKDLVGSINDEFEAQKIADKLLKWTEQKQLHILTVLHQNKGDNNARGHLGTELQNKAETVLSVTKDKNGDFSLVEPEYCRNKEPQSFAFKINESGLPEPVEDWELTKEKHNTQKGITPLEIPEATQLQIIDTTFKSNKEPKISELVSNAKTAFELLRISTIGDNKAKDFINHWVNNDFILKVGKDRSPKAYYKLNPKFFDNLTERILPM